MDECAARVALGYKPVTQGEAGGVLTSAMNDTLDNCDRKRKGYSRPQPFQAFRLLVCVCPILPNLCQILVSDQMSACLCTPDEARLDNANVYTIPINYTDLVICGPYARWRYGPGVAGLSQFFSAHVRCASTGQPSSRLHIPSCFGRYAGRVRRGWCPPIMGDSFRQHLREDLSRRPGRWSVRAGACLSVLKEDRELVTFVVPLTQAHRKCDGESCPANACL